MLVEPAGRQDTGSNGQRRCRRRGALLHCTALPAASEAPSPLRPLTLMVADASFTTPSTLSMVAPCGGRAGQGRVPVCLCIERAGPGQQRHTAQRAGPATAAGLPASTASTARRAARAPAAAREWRRPGWWGRRPGDQSRAHPTRSRRRQSGGCMVGPGGSLSGQGCTHGSTACAGASRQGAHSGAAAPKRPRRAPAAVHTASGRQRCLQGL